MSWRASNSRLFVDIAADQRNAVAQLDAHHVRQAAANEDRVPCVGGEELSGHDILGHDAGRGLRLRIDTDDADGERAFPIGRKATGLDSSRG